MISQENAESLRSFIHQLVHLHVDKKSGHYAPHKPVLLLAIMQMIEERNITNPDIQLSEGLVAEFRKQWNTYLTGRNGYTCNIAMPFLHMQSEPFWRLVTHEESLQQKVQESSSDAERRKMILKCNASVKAIRSTFSHANIDPTLFKLMQDETLRTYFKFVIWEKYLKQDASSTPLGKDKTVKSNPTSSQGDVYITIDKFYASGNPELTQETLEKLAAMLPTFVTNINNGIVTGSVENLQQNHLHMDKPDSQQ